MILAIEMRRRNATLVNSETLNCFFFVFPMDVDYLILFPN